MSHDFKILNVNQEPRTPRTRITIILIVTFSVLKFVNFYFKKPAKIMNQAEVSKLMSQLRVAIPAKHRKLRNIDGPEGRLRKLRKTVTALIKHERIELNWVRADEARAYAERVNRRLNKISVTN